MKDFILTHQALFYGFATAGTLASAVMSVGLAGIRIRLVSLSRRDVEEAVASVTAEKRAHSAFCSSADPQHHLHLLL